MEAAVRNQVIGTARAETDLFKLVDGDGGCCGPGQALVRRLAP